MTQQADRQSESSGVLAPERRWLTLGILLCVVAFAVEGMGVTPALPTAVRSLDGLPLFGWVFSAFMLAWLVGTVAGGQLADRHGPQRSMALGLFGFAAGLLLAAAATGMAQFLAGRVLQGLGGGSMMAAAYVAIARAYPDSLRARMMALIATAWVLPALVGPTVAGLLTERASWRLIFVGVVPMVVLAAALVLPPLRPLNLTSPPSRSDHLRTLLALRLALGTALVLLWPSLRPTGLLFASLVAGVGLLLLLPALGQLLPVGTLRAQPGLPMGILARALLAFSFFGTESFVPLSASELRGASPTAAGLALTTGALGWSAATWLQDRSEAAGRRSSADRVGRVKLGFLLLALGIVILAAALLTSLPLLILPLGWAVAGAGTGWAFGTGTLLCMALAPPGKEGEVSSQLQLAEALATAIGAGAGGALLMVGSQLGLAPRLAAVPIFALTLLAALLGRLLSGRLATAKVAAGSG